MTAIAARAPWPTESRPRPHAGPQARTYAQPVPAAGAACSGQAHLFFPDNGDDTAAKAICATCPVRARCLAGAVERGETWGVWGGRNFGPKRPGPQWADGGTPRGVQAMNRAEYLAGLRRQHRTLTATAAAAGVTTDTVRFYLILAELDASTQDLIRSGTLSPADAVSTARRDRTTGRRP